MSSSTYSDDMLFIVNPISGKGRNASIAGQLKEMGINCIFTDHAGHAVEIAAASKESAVVAVGGDGTVNEVGRGLFERVLKHPDQAVPALGIIPCGSGDGLARSLGISRNFKKAMSTLAEGKRQKLDCAMIDGHMFFSVCGVGLDAMVSERFAAAGKRGLKTYVEEALKLWKHFRPETYRVCVDGKEHEFKAALITVANSRQWGNGARIAPKAETGDGWLDISVVDMFRSDEIPLLVWRLMSGTLDESKHFTGLKGKEIIIERPSEGAAHFDGDFFEAGKRLEIRLLDRHIDVIA